MAKAKVARKSTAIDMTPLVDLAFLLITFFMLTVKFRMPESVEVTTPSSIASTKVDRKNIMNLLISKEGQVFLGLSGQNDREAMLLRVAQSKGVSFTPDEVKKFKVLEDFGVPLMQLKEFLGKRPEERKQLVKTLSIPFDSTNNELGTWMLNARLANPELRIVIKADKETPYPVIRDVVDILKKQKANKFNLITTQEDDPRRKVAQ